MEIRVLPWGKEERKEESSVGELDIREVLN